MHKVTNLQIFVDSCIPNVGSLTEESNNLGQKKQDHLITLIINLPKVKRKHVTFKGLRAIFSSTIQAYMNGSPIFVCTLKKEHELCLSY